jgi:hypothetical protein
MAEYPELRNQVSAADSNQEYQFRDPAFDRNAQDGIGSGLLNNNPHIARKMNNILDDFNNRDSYAVPHGVMKSDIKLSSQHDDN